MDRNAEDFVYALAASPGFAQDGICFAARQSGLYHSADGGLTWQPSYDSLNLAQPLMTTAIAVSPDFVTDRAVFAGVPGGVLRSTDGGEHWQIVTLPTPPPAVSVLAVSPDFAHDGVVLAGTIEDGVFYSADRGRHWVAWNFGLLDLSVFSMAISPDFARDETLFVGTESGIFRSTNGGRAWREVPFPAEFAPVISLALSPEYGDDGVLFAGTEANGLFYSEDRQYCWTRLGVGAIADVVNGIVLSPEVPARPEVLAALDTALLVSRNRGKTWSDWQAGLTIEQAITSVVAPQGLASGAPLLVGLAGGGVLRV